MNKPKVVAFSLIALMVLSTIAAMRFGAIEVSFDQIAKSIWQSLLGKPLTLDQRIFMNLRLPRVLLCIITGAGLAAAGVLMQALFRNPIVEPGLVGTSAGAAFGASLYFVLGATFHFHAGEFTLPIAACIGGLLATILVFSLSGSLKQKASIVGLLLTGIAINALFLSGIGFLSYIARDPQARSITFWNLGTISGANWQNVLLIGTITLLCLIVALRYAKPLNALMMGENEAALVGVNITKLKLEVMTVNVILVSTITAFTGVIGFVGLIVPHILRLLTGSNNRSLLLNSISLGATVILLADLISRTSFKPAELPIGIVTSVVGVPVFLVLLKRGKFYF